MDKKTIPYYDEKWWLEVYSQDVRQAQVAVGEWANGDRIGLVLYGKPGCGKTHMAQVVVRHFEDPLYVRMISEPDLLASLRESYNGNGSEKRIIGNLSQIPMLIIDDVGAAHVKRDSLPWLQDIYWRLLDGRSADQRPTLITTNLPNHALADRLGSRASSRLSGLLQGKERDFIDMSKIEDYRRRKK